MKSMRMIRYALWGVVLLVTATVSGVYVGRLVAGEPIAMPTPNVGAAAFRARYQDAGGPFTMVDTNGRTFTQDDLKGRPFAMFFGFLNCPDVCPTAMMDAREWLEALGPDAEKVRIVFVTVDPARDTPEAMKEYLGAFDPRIVGLSPVTDEELARVAKAYAVKYERVDLGDGGYAMSHTSDTLLFDADGTFADYIPYAASNVRADPQAAADFQAAAVAKLRELAS